jgi:DNA-directed RNA polymerase subunit F
MGIYKGFEQGRNYRANSINPLFYFWDLSALKSDFSDAEFMGEWYYQDAPSIFEQYRKLSKEARTHIEKYNNLNNNAIHRIINGIYTIPGGKIPVYEVYWKDTEPHEYGYVYDEFGYPYFTRINHSESKYTDKDLIDPPTEKEKKEFGENKKTRIFVDVLRFAKIIPAEEISGVNGEDILLDYGIAPYQEKELSDPANVKFPYKVYTWCYDRGEVLTPLDDAIDPQRFLNRTLSVVESHMSNMRGTGTVISKSAVDDRDGEADVLRNINASKPIFVDTDRVGSVQNAIGTYGTNLGSGTLQMFEVINTVQASIQDVTGVNESMTGTQGAEDALVGVVEAQIQRGSLVQEPFYYALSSILRQAYNHMATVGKMIYIENPRRLAMMVGDRSMININLNEDHLLQDYRIFVNRSETKEQGIQAGNQLLFTLLQAGLIDQERFANLFDRSNSRTIAKALREFYAEKKQAQLELDKVQAAKNMQEGNNQQAMLQMLANQEQEEGATEQLNKELDHERKMEEITAKEAAKTERDMLKSNGMDESTNFA